MGWRQCYRMLLPWRTEQLLQVFYIWEPCHSLAYLPVIWKMWARINSENKILKVELNRHLLMYVKILGRFRAGVQRAPENSIGHSVTGVSH